MNAVLEERPAAPAGSLAAIVTHPLRRRIWYAITENPISPRELADQLREPVNDVAYHVRVLRDLGVIELAGTRPVRGATQHFYRLLRRSHLSTEEVEAMSPVDKIADATNILQLEFADAADSLEAGKLAERPEHYLFRMPVSLDEEGWQEFHEIFAEAADRLYKAEVRCVDRRREAGAEAESVSVVAHLNLFERG
ncbi:MAG: winged helix-turn-helix transcriptional regulator [Actinobacteria bacterium]|nr:winged helix-turn-helix transcriptional regulator [Actinomycetota bacterium]